MQLKLPPFLALPVFSLMPAPVACQQTQEQMSQPPLEVRLTTPSWQKGSLKVGVDCVNHSSTLRYLPVMGTYISLAVNEAATESVSWGPHRLHREPSFTTATTHALALLWSA